jgi:hypothetical protein
LNRLNNLEKERQQDREWRARNIEAARAKRRKYYYENAALEIASSEKWQAKNPAKVKISSKKSYARRKTDPKWKLRFVMHGGIYKALKGMKSGRKWESLVGYTVDQLKKHLEGLFIPGMTWDNYGTAWEIDHKIPIAAFNYSKPEDIDVRLCRSLKNLQPLACSTNRSKGAKLEQPFQPSLRMVA